MNKKTSALALTTLVVTLGVGIVGISTTFAASNMERTPFENLQQSLVKRFGLNPDEVKEVFDQHHDLIKQDHDQKMEEHFQTMIEDGTLTQEQVDALNIQKEEMKAFQEALKTMTPEERQIAMEAHRKKMNAWAQENNLPEMLLFKGDGKNPHQGFKQHRPFQALKSW